MMGRRVAGGRYRRGPPDLYAGPLGLLGMTVDSGTDREQRLQWGCNLIGKTSPRLHSPLQCAQRTCNEIAAYGPSPDAVTGLPDVRRPGTAASDRARSFVSGDGRTAAVCRLAGTSASTRRFAQPGKDHQCRSTCSG